MNFINVGFGNFVAVQKIIAIISPDSAPVKRTIQDAKNDKKLINATYGRRARSVLILADGQVMLSAVQPETIVNRAHSSLNELQATVEKIEKVETESSDAEKN